MNQDWQRGPLIDFAELVSTGPFGSMLHKSDYVSDGVPLINPINIVGESIVPDAEKQVSADALSRLASYALKVGDVVVGRRGEIGRCAVVGAAEDGWVCGTGCFFIRPRPTTNPHFLARLLRSPVYQERLERASTGATMKNMSNTTLAQLPVALPVLEEQRRIVAILDEAFEGIATAKANAEKNLQNARELFASHARNAFARVAKQWAPKSIDRISRNLDSRRVPITKSERRPGEYPYYGASGIVDYVADYIFDGDALLISEDGANLLARSTPIAFSAAGRYWVNNHAHIVEFDDLATQKFVEFYLNSIALDEYITGAAQPKLNQKALNSIPIPIPESSEEQAQVVARLESVAEQLELLEETYKRKLAALDELKKSLLHQAFSGAL